MGFPIERDEAYRRRTILVVDDDEAIRDLLVDILTEAGFRVIEAGDGKEALRQVKRFSRVPLDLVITDLVMPEQEGLETIRELRHEFPLLKVIAISGYQWGTYLQHATMLGACATIKKPFAIDAVLRTVHEVLQTAAPAPAGSVSGESRTE